MLGFINFFILQWFFVRLAYGDDGKFYIMFPVLPLSGWDFMSLKYASAIRLGKPLCTKEYIYFQKYGTLSISAHFARDVYEGRSHRFEWDIESADGITNKHIMHKIFEGLVNKHRKDLIYLEIICQDGNGICTGK